MPTPRHVPWNQGDDQYSGDFDKTVSQTVALDGTNQDFDIAFGHVGFIYRITVTTTASAWSAVLHSKKARAASDLVYDTGSQLGSSFQVEDTIVYVDKDGTSNLHLRVNGESGKSLTITFDAVRYT